MEIFIKQNESGRWMGWPKDRPDIIASGETKDECIENINYMHSEVIKHENGLLRGVKPQAINTTSCA